MTWCGSCRDMIQQDLFFEADEYIARKDIMAKVGRNEPCPCGSGKKYKRCCLAKDEQEEREARQRIEAAAASALNPSLGKKGQKPETEADRLWERFEAADYESRIAIFLETLESGEMDEELAFEMLLEIWDVAVEKGDQERFRGLAERLQREAPAAYEANAFYFNRWMLEDALDRARTELVPGLLAPFARDPDSDIDGFFRVMDLLMYYGQVDPLLETMAAARPSLGSSGKLLPGVEDEFIEMGAQLTVLNHLEKGGTPDLEDPRLQTALSPFLPVLDDGWLRLTLAVVSGARSRSWALSDFQRQELKETDEDLSERLRLFSLEWLRYLWREREVALTRGELARVEMVRHQEEQVDKDRDRLSVLVPKPRELDDHLAGLLHFANPLPARAATMLELLPEYLRFLTRHGLLSAREEKSALQSLRKVHHDTVSLLRDHLAPLLAPAAERAWQRAA